MEKRCMMMLFFLGVFGLCHAQDMPNYQKVAGYTLDRSSQEHYFDIDEEATVFWECVISWSENTDTVIVYPMIKGGLGYWYYPGFDSICITNKDGVMNVWDMELLYREGEDTLLYHKISGDIFLRITARGKCVIENIYFMQENIAKEKRRKK